MTPIRQLAPPERGSPPGRFLYGTGQVLSAVNLKSAFPGAAIGWTVSGMVQCCGLKHLFREWWCR